MLLKRSARYPSRTSTSVDPQLERRSCTLKRSLPLAPLLGLLNVGTCPILERNRVKQLEGYLSKSQDQTRPFDLQGYHEDKLNIPSQLQVDPRPSFVVG
jgi:hypothetical protein